MNVVVRAVRTEDVPGVLDLVRVSFDRALHPFLIITQPGAVAYLRAFIEHASYCPDRRFVLAESREGELLGHAEYRAMERGEWHLAYICVAAKARRTGVATRLIRQGLGQAERVDTVRLNVFTHNTPAITLYRKLGFEAGTETIWWITPVQPSNPSQANRLRFHDLPVAVATFEKYGFCQLRGTFNGKPFLIGRTSRSVLRCYDEGDFQDAELLASLRSAFPETRSALLMLPATAPAPAKGTREVTRSLEMEWRAPGS